MQEGAGDLIHFENWPLAFWAAPPPNTHTPHSECTRSTGDSNDIIATSLHSSTAVHSTEKRLCCAQGAVRVKEDTAPHSEPTPHDSD